jgi:methionyl-tRNA formyltransferase
MRLLFAGTPQVAVPSLQALIESRHEVVGVLTRPDAPAGRGRAVQISPVAALAHEAGIEILRPAKPSDPEFLARLGQIAPDAAPIVAYGGLIPRSALDVPSHGWVNLHFSLLPAWRGAAPVQHAVLHGDDMTGACTFLLEEGLDTGPVFGTVTEPINPRDTSGELLERLSITGARLLVETLDGMEAGALVPVPQPVDGVSLAPKLTGADARIPMQEPALAIDRRIRACTPAPGAWCMFKSERIKLFPVQLDMAVTHLKPGALEVSKNCIRVGTGSHAVVLGDVQPAGKKRMSAADWVRGSRIESGETIE